MEYEHIVCVFHNHAVEFEAMHNACMATLSTGPDMFHDNVIDVSTMTLSCTLTTGVDLAALTHAKNSGKIASAGLDTKTDSLFPNQVTMIVPRLQDGPRPARRRKRKRAGTNVKVCPNGSMNLTGCKSLHEGCFVVALLLKVLSEVGAVPTHARLLKVKLGMINTILDLGVAVRLDDVMRRLERAHITCHYDTERHAGVRLTTSDGYAFIFRSGSITCGSSRFAAVPRLWQTIAEALTCKSTTYSCDTATALGPDTKARILKALVDNNIDCFKPCLDDSATVKDT